jgi:hypothetical protein
MFASTQELRPMQDLLGTMENHSIDVPLELVPPHAEMIHPLLPDDFFEPAPEDEDDDTPDQFWHSPRYDRSQTHVLWAYLTAKEHGWINAEQATKGLLEAGVFPYELAIDMLTTCLRSLAEGEAA